MSSINEQLQDRYGRHVDYLRISITDHCNLRCFYCSPFGGRAPLAHDQILRYEEILKIVTAAVAAGIRKVRITGGEPLVRKSVIEFCRNLSRIQGLKHLALTTNGMLLEKMAAPLHAAGIQRVNVSLDTLVPEKFKKITGHGDLARVLAGIDAAQAVGMQPIKINTVLMRGVNDDEAVDFARLAMQRRFHVRFIELMPTMGWSSRRHEALYMPCSEIMPQLAPLLDGPVKQRRAVFGPARMYALKGGGGQVGFISPLGQHFCGSCNRLRLTAEGTLRTCLFCDEEIDIKGPLRAGASIDDLRRIFCQAVALKPDGHHLQQHQTPQGHFNGRTMNAIGG